MLNWDLKRVFRLPVATKIECQGIVFFAKQIIIGTLLIIFISTIESFDQIIPSRP